MENENTLSNKWFMPHVVFNNFHSHVHKNRDKIKTKNFFFFNVTSPKLDKAFTRQNPFKR